MPAENAVFGSVCMNGQFQRILTLLRGIDHPRLIPERQIAASAQRIHRFQRVAGLGASPCAV